MVYDVGQDAGQDTDRLNDESYSVVFKEVVVPLTCIEVQAEYLECIQEKEKDGLHDTYTRIEKAECATHFMIIANFPEDEL